MKLTNLAARRAVSIATSCATPLARLGLLLCVLAAFEARAQADNILKPGMSGDAVCTRCHDATEKKPILAVHRTRHGVAAQPGCQACHGSSRPHVQHTDTKATRPPADFVFSGKNRSSPEIQSRTCLNCHKAGKRLFWQGSTHPGNDITCANCHTIHAAEDRVLQRETQREVCFACHKTQRAQTLYASNHGFAEGKVLCADCHNPHGTTTAHLLVKNSVNETCFTCHAGLRGPFLWEHPPATDDCSHCHTPHGSIHAPLLKARPPWLCQSCHAGSVHTTPALSGRGLPPASGGNASQQLLLRACLNCHSAVHGSNHPSGARFTR
jgi:DmsE family decaheme c-type cytochrome